MPYITPLMREQCKTLSDKYGKRAQDIKLIEECSDLISQVSRELNELGSNSKLDTIYEIAYVYNMLDQWVINHDLPESEIIGIREKKMRRAIERAEK